MDKDLASWGEGTQDTAKGIEAASPLPPSLFQHPHFPDLDPTEEGVGCKKKKRQRSEAAPAPGRHLPKTLCEERLIHPFTFRNGLPSAHLVPGAGDLTASKAASPCLPELTVLGWGRKMVKMTS